MINNAIHFIFDSEHIDAMQTRLYGFYTTEAGMFTEAPPAGENISDATGTWVLVKSDQDGIEVTQDTVGCFGLFLFCSGNYWALSNSFNHLLDYLKGRFKLSLNEEYAAALLVQNLCASVYGETIVNEISWLDRRAKVHIDKKTGELTVSLRNLSERTVPIDSAEGLQILDTWHDKWASFMRGAAMGWPERIVVDVSGGFDSRMVLAPVLSAKVDPSRIVFNSIPRLEDDYRIATLLAEEFGFQLNMEPESITKDPIPPVEVFADRALNIIFFEKEIYLKSPVQILARQMAFSGAGGEIARGYWGDLNQDAMIGRELKKVQKHNLLPQDNCFQHGIEAIIRRSFSSIERMLNQVGEGDGTGIDGLRYYMETRNRSHFGLEMVRHLLSERYVENPLLDPLLLKLRSPLDDKHPSLIPAIVFTRYHEKLASTPFEGGRSISESTMQLARELNKRYPRIANSDLTPYREAHVWQVIHVPPEVVQDDTAEANPVPMDVRFLEAYESKMVRDSFIQLFGSDPDIWVDPSSDKRHPNANKYAIVAIAKTLDDTKRGKEAYKDFESFVEACRKENASTGSLPELCEEEPLAAKEELPHSEEESTSGIIKLGRKVRRLLSHLFVR